MQNFLQIGGLEINSGKTSKIELEVGNFNTSLFLILDYLITVAGAAPSDRHRFGNILNIIQEIKITLNDRDDILRLSGQELMAIYIADNGRKPTTIPTLPYITEAQQAIFPINHWTTNSNLIALTGHDYRAAKKAVLQITWGNVASLYRVPGSAEITSLNIDFEQQATHKYRSPVKAVNGKGRPIRYNPAVRHFERSTMGFDASKSDAVLGEMEGVAGVMGKGLIMFARLGDKVMASALSGTIRITQGNTTVASVNLDVLQAAQETAKGVAPPPEVFYLPFSALFQSSEFEFTNQWKDNLVIRGDYTKSGLDGEEEVVILLDGYRQEKLK